MDGVPGPHKKNHLTINLDRFDKPHLMITQPVVIPGYREAVNFIITRIELKSDSFMKFNRTFIHRGRTGPYNGSAMRSANFKKTLV